MNHSNQLPFVSGSVTSWEAADSMIKQATSLRDKIFTWLYYYGPATDKEMQAGLGMDGSTQRPRRVELHKAGRIEPIELVMQGNGRRATVWRVI